MIWEGSLALYFFRALRCNGSKRQDNSRITREPDYITKSINKRKMNSLGSEGTFPKEPHQEQKGKLTKRTQIRHIYKQGEVNAIIGMLPQRGARPQTGGPRRIRTFDRQWLTATRSGLTELWDHRPTKGERLQWDSNP